MNGSIWVRYRRVRFLSLASGVIMAFTLLTVTGGINAEADDIFGNGFESGDICGWSSFAAQCYTEEALAAVISETYETCIPYMEVAVGPYTLDVCGGGTCPDGGTGCPVTVHVDTWGFSFVSYTAYAAVSADPFSIDLVSFPLVDCDLTFTNVDASGDFVAVVGPLCGSSTREITAVTDVNLVLSYDMSGCPTLAPYLALITGQLETLLMTEVESALQDHVVGMWICP